MKTGTRWPSASQGGRPDLQLLLELGLPVSRAMRKGTTCCWKFPVGGTLSWQPQPITHLPPEPSFVTVNSKGLGPLWAQGGLEHDLGAAESNKKRGVHKSLYPLSGTTAGLCPGGWRAGRDVETGERLPEDEWIPIPASEHFPWYLSLQKGSLEWNLKCDSLWS